MRSFLKKLLLPPLKLNIKLLGAAGYQVLLKEWESVDMGGSFSRGYEVCRQYTMTSRARMYAVYSAIEYICKQQVPGDIVECGVWKGGSMMMAALALQEFGDTSRRLYLYDTFEGMSEPTAADVDYRGRTAADEMSGLSTWLAAGVQEVRGHMEITGYPADKTVYCQGKVEDTIPAKVPGQIALLRLDTDWYESTRHELEYLYPLIAPGGILIIDDYGHWKGSTKAVDEYIEKHGLRLFLSRIDYSGRLAVKPW